MSAFVVSKKHIDTLVTYFANRGYERVYYNGESKEYTCDQLGQALLDANYKSVNYRYNSDAAPQTPYKYRVSPKYNAIQIIKSAKCSKYQSCEHPDFKGSFAEAILDAIINKAINNLPGYSDLEWDIPDW